MAELIEVYGGKPVNNYATSERREQEKRSVADHPAWNLSPRQLCDVELLLNGAFSPLRGFQSQADYDRILREMRLVDGTLWPLPVILDVTEEFAAKAEVGTQIALNDAEGVVIAILTVSDHWRPDRQQEALKVYGTNNDRHPGVYRLLHGTRPVYLGGTLIGMDVPTHYDFKNLRYSPAELRAKFIKLGWTQVVAYQTRSPIHRLHWELTQRAIAASEANLLIHAVSGPTESGDVDYFTRVRCHERLLPRYQHNTTELNLLPLQMRLAGPREALLHAIVNRNYGCSHLVVGVNYAEPGSFNEPDFRADGAAQKLMAAHQDELGVQGVFLPKLVCVGKSNRYLPANEVVAGESVTEFDAAEIKQRLDEGRETPDWLTFPDIYEELTRTYPPRYKRGFTVFFTGLSGSGKSTIANALRVKLLEMGGRSVTLLDGDIVRKNLSSELGFSREHRDLNVRRIGFVAAEITRHGGIAVCAPIAPYQQTRREIRETIEAHGGFLEIHVATSLEMCESRDRKGLYAKARAGVLKEFTGISDPYEAPKNPELAIDTKDHTPDEAAQRIILKLESLGYLR